MGTQGVVEDEALWAGFTEASLGLARSMDAVLRALDGAQAEVAASSAREAAALGERLVALAPGINQAWASLKAGLPEGGRARTAGGPDWAETEDLLSRTLELSDEQLAGLRAHLQAATASAASAPVPEVLLDEAWARAIRDSVERLQKLAQACGSRSSR